MIDHLGLTWYVPYEVVPKIRQMNGHSYITAVYGHYNAVSKVGSSAVYECPMSPQHTQVQES